MKTLIYDLDSSLEEVLKEHSSGTIYLCPVCQSELIIAVTPSEVNEKMMHPGIVCPQSRGHVFLTLNTNSNSTLWKRLREKK